MAVGDNKLITEEAELEIVYLETDPRVFAVLDNGCDRTAHGEA